jgi:hypothetical protein
MMLASTIRFLFGMHNIANKFVTLGQFAPSPVKGFGLENR